MASSIYMHGLHSVKSANIPPLAILANLPPAEPNGSTPRREYCRISRLLCDLSMRLRRLDKTAARPDHIPLTRGEISEHLGISLARTKRAMGLLALSGVIRIDADGIKLLDWNRLCAVARFDPSPAEREAEGDGKASGWSAAAPQIDQHIATLCGDPAYFE